MFAIISTLTLLVFVFGSCFAIISDFRSLRIPNWISLIMLGGFAIYAMAFWQSIPILMHLAIAGAMLVPALLFYALGWFGGGDLKFLTVTGLWVGPALAVNFVVLLALLSVVLAGSLLIFQGRLKQGYLVPEKPWIWHRTWQIAEQGVCPYGIAIGIAGLIVVPPAYLAT